MIDIRLEQKEIEYLRELVAEASFYKRSEKKLNNDEQMKLSSALGKALV